MKHNIFLIGIVLSVIVLAGCTKTDIKYNNLKEGDSITIGYYEQDGNSMNGLEKIEWEVINVEDNRALLISKNVLDFVPYHNIDPDEEIELNWSNCSIREWMNNEFYENAFSNDEKELITETNLSNPVNSFSDEAAISENTTDKIFALSVEEIRNYYDFVTWDDYAQYGCSVSLITPATTFAKQEGVNTYIITEQDYEDWAKDEGYPEEVVGKEAADWWLRTSGSNSLYGCSVSFDGMAGDGWYYEIESGIGDHVGIRPAMYIQIQK